jgi:ribosomal protein S18 acetylase RimI-like enzyme
MDINYCEGTEGDVPAFLAYFRTSTPLLFPQYSSNMLGYLIDVDYSPEWLAERLSKKAKKVYIAKHRGEIVGYLLVSRPNAGIAFGDWLAVDKEFQKKGIATSLLSMWEKDVLAYGGHNIYLWTYEHNIDFYKKRGFVQGGFLPKGWGGEDAYFMYKIIAEPKEENYLRHYLEKKKRA